MRLTFLGSTGRPVVEGAARWSKAAKDVNVNWEWDGPDGWMTVVAGKINQTISGREKNRSIWWPWGLEIGGQGIRSIVGRGGKKMTAI
jgi:hypothetical protein